MNGKDRKINSTAPGRAGIIGNPSDMYGGAVISCSVGMRAKVTLAPHSTLTIAAGGEECKIQDPQDLELQGDRFDIARAILQYLGLPEEPFRLAFESSVPFRSGLSGSTALLVAVLHGILAWQNEHPQKYELAEKARFIEYNHLKIVGGYQDAYMSVFGGLNYMDFRGKQFDQNGEAELFGTVEPIGCEESDLPFILATTGVQRISGAVHKPVGERWLSGETQVVQGYKRIAELAKLGKKALLNADWEKLGELMNENHRIQRKLGGSGESNERLISAAFEAGGLGAKLAGAGEGGTIITLWPLKDKKPVERALRKAGAAAIYHPVIGDGADLNIEEF